MYMAERSDGIMILRVESSTPSAATSTCTFPLNDWSMGTKESIDGVASTNDAMSMSLTLMSNPA